MFENNKHEINTVEVNKVTLNRDDDKGIVKKGGISTLARGPTHYAGTPYSGLYR